LKAGAEIIISNNFYTSRTMMNVIGEQDRWEEYTRRGGELACQTRDTINPDAYVAGGIAPPEHKCNLYEQFVEQARVLADVGVDFMLTEYMAGDSYAHLEYNENPKFGSSPDEHFFTIGRGEYTPERYAEAAVGWKEVGAQIIGGCCATTPDHIRAVRAAIKP
jgi:methionine synthase I (cobalamin-dependent)